MKSAAGRVKYIGWCFIVIYPIWLCVQVAGAIDTVIAHINDPGWIGMLTRWVVRISAVKLVFPSAIFVAGIAILLLDRRGYLGSFFARFKVSDDSAHFRSRGIAESKPAPARIEIDHASAIADVRDLRVSSTIKVTNVGDVALERSCVAKVEKLTRLVRVDRSSVVPKAIADFPLIVLRTEGQCRDGERKGAFTLRPGEFKFVPLLWCEHASEQPFFMTENGDRLPIADGFFVAQVSVYGPTEPAREQITLEIGPRRRVATGVVGEGPVNVPIDGVAQRAS
jgi:hypothetical protein